MPFQRREVGYTDKKGNINYLDGSGLSRPFSMPIQPLVVVGAFVVVAVVIGYFIVQAFYDNTLGTTIANEAVVDENLARDSDYDLPALTSIVGLDADEIRSFIAEGGYLTYEETDEDDAEDEDSDSDDELYLVKFPSDMDLDEATELYTSGISSLSAADASLLLKGMWMLSASWDSGVNMVVRYVDFSSGSLEDAVDTAIEAQGFDAESATVVAEDDSGNTYRSGTVEVDGVEYTWRVSTIELTEVYGIDGLPDDSYYVGVRIYS